MKAEEARRQTDSCNSDLVNRYYDKIQKKIKKYADKGEAEIGRYVIMNKEVAKSLGIIFEKEGYKVQVFDSNIYISW